MFRVCENWFKLFYSVQSYSNQWKNAPPNKSICCCNMAKEMCAYLTHVNSSDRSLFYGSKIFSFVRSHAFTTVALTMVERAMEHRFTGRHLTFVYILTPLNVFSVPNVHSMDDDDDAKHFEWLPLLLLLLLSYCCCLCLKGST